MAFDDVAREKPDEKGKSADEMLALSRLAGKPHKNAPREGAKGPLIPKEARMPLAIGLGVIGLLVLLSLLRAFST